MRTYLELGPEGVLSAMVHDCLGEIDGAGGISEKSAVLTAPTLRAGRAESRSLMGALAQLWVGGARVDWPKMLGGAGGKRADLPTYAFQRRPYWLQADPSDSGDLTAAGQISAGHPLLGASVALAESDRLLFTGRLSLSSHAWLADHAVAGTVLLPGTAFLELALHAGRRVGCERVKELVLEEPLIVPEQGAVTLQVSVGELDEASCRSLHIYSRRQDLAGEEAESAEWTCHASGTLATDSSARESIGLESEIGILAGEEWPPTDAQSLGVEGLYERMAEQGLEYGPTFQGLRASWRYGERVLAEVALADDDQAEAGLFTIHPALLDAALHAMATDTNEHVDSPRADPDVRLPFSWREVDMHARGVGTLRACISPIGENAFSVVLSDETGAAVASVGSLSLRAASAELLRGQSGALSSLLSCEWIAVDSSSFSGASPGSLAGVSEIGGWAVLGGNGQLVEGLEAAGVTDSQDNRIGSYADLAALAEAVEGGAMAPTTVLVNLVSGADSLLDRDRTAGGAPAKEDSAGMPAAARERTRHVLDLVQGWLADERFADSRLILVTHCAVATRAGEAVPGIVNAPLWGLVRSAQVEAEGRLMLVDMDRLTDSWSVLPGVLALDEPQVAVRQATMFVPRLARKAGGLTPSPEAGEWQLEVGNTGTLDGLRLLESSTVTDTPAAGQIRVGVRAAGLNFRDVLMTLGVYPGEVAIGSEGAGVVLEVGPDVEEIAVGDRVMGLFSGAFGSVAVTDQRLVAHIPDGWSFAEAASVPSVFLTAYYALTDLAKAQPGESLLVHAAAGGVGMAAVQLAGHLGMEVFGTASPGKWGVLESLGMDVAHRASSRDLKFRESVLASTGGQGVNVVLNSLAGEFIDASLDVLAEGGRFIEMGKADIRDGEEIVVQRPKLSYRAFELMEAGPERLQEMLKELIELFEAGTLEPLPITAWDMRHAPDAFRFMSQARHVGKIVLTLPAPSFDRAGTVMITGGTGGLGALVAKHLVLEHGVRSLALASRRGAEAPGAMELMAELEGLGAQVSVTACDVSDRNQLRTLIEALPPGLPLRGVVHAAGVLDDGLIGSLTGERLNRVLAVKVDAAWHLHELTRNLDLDAFVLFSSAAGVIGSPGQGNYAAGNAFLDALAQDRRAQGLAGVSMAWGLWAQAEGMAGMLNEADLARLKSTGMVPLAADEGLALFDLAYAGGEALAIPIHLDVRVLRANARAGLTMPLLQGLVGKPSRLPESGGTIAQRMAGLNQAERERLVLELVRGEVAAVLGHSSSGGIDTQRTFRDLGFDSLLAVELRNRMDVLIGRRLPATLVFDYPNPIALAKYLLGAIEGVRGGSAFATSVAKPTDEPIAIVGMGCRYPGGVYSPRQLWELVALGGDAMSSMPLDRGWDLTGFYEPDLDRPGSDRLREGGFVHDADRFDAGFFGISPREAMLMDPQQRLLLEVSWEALEDARVDPFSLRGSNTGVFAGISSSDYGSGLGTDARGRAGSGGGFGLTGATTSVASGRVSYVLGLEGPAVSVDTACSSSLVALHLGCGSLRGGECSLVLVGGVTVMSTPMVFVEFGRQGALAGDGRCKSFADAADGTGWGEGVGVLVLERLSDALRNGRRVLGVVRGSAVNQDGASNGLTAPNGPSQQRVIGQALANAGLSAGQVDAVEAHGTGTTLGDPIEAQALLATYGQGRENGRPLWLGSVKSNIGHTQAAAGVSGVIKMVMALRRGVLPKTLHVDRPTSHVDWSAGSVSLLTEEVSWERDGGEPRRAGVSSFGISGTNAHVILEEAPVLSGVSSSSVSLVDVPVVGSSVVGASGVGGELDGLSGGVGRVGGGLGGGVVPWVVSGRGEDGLCGQAGRLFEFVSGDVGLSVGDVGLSLAGRSVFGHRAVVLGGDREELLEGVGLVERGESGPGVLRGVAGSGGGVVFVFPGQGSQWEGMAVELLDCSGVFAGCVGECGDVLEGFVGWRVEDVLRGVGGAPGLDRVDVVQPVLFCVMVALAGLWRACGVEPSAVVGHSQGEIAAAYVAGGLSLEDAVRVVALRSRVLVGLAGRGGMVSVAAGVEVVGALLEGFGGGVSVAAVNGPSAVVVSGERGALDGFLGLCGERGLRAREIPVDYAAHSVQVEDVRGELLGGCEGIVPCSGDVPFYSAVTGGLFDTSGLDGGYWYRNLRETVQFESVTRGLVEAGYGTFIEVSPHPVLTVGVEETAEGLLVEEGSSGGGVSVGVFGSLRRGEGTVERFVRSLAEGWVGGIDVDWSGLFNDTAAQPVDLPTYAFQHKRHWLGTAIGSTGDLVAVGQASAGHPLLGAVVAPVAGADWLFTGRLSLEAHPWLVDYMVMDRALLPSTAMLELALHVSDRLECGGVQELKLEAPLVVSEQGAVQLRVSVGEADELGCRVLNIHSRLEELAADEVNPGAWTRNAVGVLARVGPEGERADQGPSEDMTVGGEWPPRDAVAVEVEDLYEWFAERGVEYGPTFRGLRAAWRHGKDVLVEVVLPEEQHGQAKLFGIHPALLDAALQGLRAGADRDVGKGDVLLPGSWSGVELFAEGLDVLRGRLSPSDEGTISVVLADEDGKLVARVRSLVMSAVSQDQLTQPHQSLHNSLFSVDWVPVDGSSPPDECVVLGTGKDPVEHLDAAEIGIVDGAVPGVYVDLVALGEAIGRGRCRPIRCSSIGG